ncbi:hypothetical protein VN1337_11980 [Helicobacter pylori]
MLSQFDKQALTNALKQEIKNEIKSGLDNLLSGSELQSESQNALMLEADVLNNKMNIENEIAYNLKRKELIQDGKLEDEAFKKFIFKVI